MWIRNLYRICDCVGYNSDEVAENLAWAEEILEEMDAWMKEEM